LSPSPSRLVAPEMPSRPGSSQTSGAPESKASALRSASTIARSSVGRLVVAVEVAARIRVHEDVGTSLQFSIDALAVSNSRRR
jgi:hypothetical protein